MLSYRRSSAGQSYFGNRYFRTALIATCVLLAAGCSHKGKIKQPTKLVEIKNPAVLPVEVWSDSVGKGSGKDYTGLRIAVGVDAIYTAEIGGSVYAIDPKTGKRIWRTKTKSPIVGGPSVAGNLVLVGTADAQVIALKRSTGEQVWRAQASSEVQDAPAAAGNMVVVKASDGREYGLDADTGERRWAFDRTVPGLTLRGLSAPLIIGNRVYIGFDSGKLVALNLTDGDVVWEQVISVPTGRTELARFTDIDADLLPAQNGLFVVTYGGDLALLDPDTGESRWRRSIKSYTGMVLGGDKLFVTDADGLVWALDAETGAAAWKQEGLKYRYLSPPAYYKGYVVVGDMKGYLHWLSPSDGSLVGRTRLGSGPIIAPPAVSDDLLYVMTASGKLAAFDIKPPK